MVNDDRFTGALERAARRVIGEANVPKDWRHCFADLGLLMSPAPGCLLLLGTASPDAGITEIWHHPAFDIDEDALPVEVHIMPLAVLDLLQ